jgi:hypothetical protein
MILGSKNELTSLAQAIRKQNSEHLFEKLLKELEAGRITHERFDAEHAAIRRIPEADFEKSVESMWATMRGLRRKKRGKDME